MKDEFISAEHLFLGAVECTKDAKLRQFFKSFELTPERVLEALKEFAGTNGSPPRIRRRLFRPSKNTASIWSRPRVVEK